MLNLKTRIRSSKDDEKGDYRKLINFIANNPKNRKKNL